ncbi:MAG: peptide deformylase, partial [bacterium]
ENGLGLAGNQVGVARRIITVKMDDGPKVFINPRLKKMSKEKVESDEGCLSFPMMLGAVKRSRSVTVVARDLDMKEVKIEAEGLLARAFQHEIDHLNGIVFLDRAEPGTVREIVIEEEEETGDGNGEMAAVEREAEA